MSRPFFHSGNSIVDWAFPVPEFLRMPAAGLDIGENAIRYIEFGNKKGEFIKRFGERRLSPGVIVGGYIHKPAEVVRLLSEIRKDTGLTFVNVSLPEEKAYLFKAELPKLSGAELRDAVGYRIEENVPISAKDSIFDYAVLAEEKKKSEHIDVLVSVIPSKVSATYASVVKEAGFMPLSFEIISQAVTRAAVPKDDSGSYLILNFGENKTGLAIVSRGVVFFTSTIAIGSASIDSMIAEIYGISSEKVSELKSEIISSGKQDMKSFLAVMESDSVLPLKEEIAKLSLYWKTHGPRILGRATKVEKIILCGKDMALPPLDEYLHTSTGINAEVSNVWRNVFTFDDYIPPISFRDSLDFAGAIGLAIS
jgi:Tfp pilus assembly PilM family ATPase